MENHEEGYVKDVDGNLIPDYETTIKLFDEGDIVRGIVVQVDRDEVLVDIGYKSEGVIPVNELSIRKDVNPIELIGIGDEIDALVLQKEDKDGRLLLSKKRAEFERAWDRVEEYNRERKPVEGTVIEVVKGGLILDIGLRGFLPASLVDVRRVKELDQYLGQKLECLIIEMDRNRNNVVLSRRAVIDEERKHERAKILGNIKKGQLINGKVSSIVDFGAFVDLGGLDGLIHISELSWSHVDHPSEVLSLGKEIKVKVLDVDQERGRISLGYKQTQENPWRKKLGDLKVGDVVSGKVTKVVPFGVFMELGGGVEALIHNSEFSQGSDVKVGDVLEAKVLEIDAERRRISMALITGAAAKETEMPEVVAGVTEATAAEDVASRSVTVDVQVEEVVPIQIFESGENAKIESGVLVDKTAEEKVALVAEEQKAKLEESSTKKRDQDLKIKLVKKKIEEDAGEIMPPQPGSLEDILQQMKQSPKTDKN